MRWRWIDRLIEFRSGHRACAVKNVSADEECLRDHFPGWPVMPASLIIEGMGQTGMLLACEAIGFAQMLLLAKIPRVRLHGNAVPGDTLVYTVTLEGMQDEGALVVASSHLRGRLQGEAELLFTRLVPKAPDGRCAALRYLVELARSVGVFEVGRTADGSPLSVPALLKGEENGFAAD